MYFHSFIIYYRHETDSLMKKNGTTVSLAQTQYREQIYKLPVIYILPLLLNRPQDICFSKFVFSGKKASSKRSLSKLLFFASYYTVRNPMNSSLQGKTLRQVYFTSHVQMSSSQC